MSYPSRTGVAVIGAGPYGLSIAAHLTSAGIDFRIFGRPMHRWHQQMPEGMFLKSEGHASSLSDPSGNYTLRRYCSIKALPYADIGTPVPVEVFTQYAQWFRQNLTPDVEDLIVTKIEKVSDEFELHLSDGSTVRAHKVVVATGLEHATRTVPALRNLPSELSSHSEDHHDLRRFKNKDVIVIGAGQSALESAALLSEQGASVQVVARKPKIVWNPVPELGNRQFYRRLRYPQACLGEGVRSWFYCNTPILFRYLPQRLRLTLATSELGPAGAWWLRERVLGRVPVLLSHFVSVAEARGGRLLLQVVGSDGQPRDLKADHVISATGYRFDVQRLPFLAARLKSAIRTFERQPILSRGFESSVPGLYFTGLASASSLGPAMRFVAGTGFTARSVSRHISDGLRRYGSRPALELAGTRF